MSEELKLTQHEISLQIAARIWCDPAYSHVEMNPHLAQTIGFSLMQEAHTQGKWLEDVPVAPESMYELLAITLGKAIEENKTLASQLHQTTAECDALKAENEKMREALEKIEKELGNIVDYGNWTMKLSDLQEIARAALEK